MKLHLHDTSKALAKTDLLAVMYFEGTRPHFPESVQAPDRTLAALSGGFRELRLFDATDGPAPRLLTIGLGKRDDVDAERLRRAAALGVRTAEADGVAHATLWAGTDVIKKLGDPEVAGRALAEGAVMGAYRFERFKTEPKRAKLATLVVAGSGRSFKKGADRGEIMAVANCFARDLQNAPANRMRPRDLAKHAESIAAQSKRLRCKILEAKAMKELGMGALLGVAAGTSEPPRLIHLTYVPKNKPKAKVAFVGKGLTFDAGGISLKPAARMWDMKYDMSGGAAVLGAFHALSRIDVPFEVHGVVPCTENLPDASAVKPGDVVTAMNGTTIEVLNTDAEGRLILCDALAYTVEKIKPDTIIDLATLTGAVVVALGHELSGLFASTERLRDALMQAGDDVGERLWPLPLLDIHKEQMRGEVADLKNINNQDLGGGSIAGAAFLSSFVGDTQWAHLDIAGTAYGGRDRDYVGGAQGSGFGARLLVRYLENAV